MVRRLEFSKTSGHLLCFLRRNARNVTIRGSKHGLQFLCLRFIKIGSLALMGRDVIVIFRVNINGLRRILFHSSNSTIRTSRFIYPATAIRGNVRGRINAQFILLRLYLLQAAMIVRSTLRRNLIGVALARFFRFYRRRTSRLLRTLSLLKYAARSRDTMVARYRQSTVAVGGLLLLGRVRIGRPNTSVKGSLQGCFRFLNVKVNHAQRAPNWVGNLIFSTCRFHLRQFHSEFLQRGLRLEGI